MYDIYIAENTKTDGSKLRPKHFDSIILKQGWDPKLLQSVQTFLNYIEPEIEAPESKKNLDFQELVSTVFELNSLVCLCCTAIKAMLYTTQHGYNC